MTFQDAMIHMINGGKIRHGNQFHVYELTDDNNIMWMKPNTGSWGFIAEFPYHMITSESWQLL